MIWSALLECILWTYSCKRIAKCINYFDHLQDLMLWDELFPNIFEYITYIKDVSYFVMGLMHVHMGVSSTLTRIFIRSEYKIGIHTPIIRHQQSCTTEPVSLTS
mmetsp:Transcript_18234/g.33041  ORF Transcript_18234/g.33041 Transcript_18234/m.33041 type:complete len:104 (-) Transcript_18234:1503-1814(-)